MKPLQSLLLPCLALPCLLAPTAWAQSGAPPVEQDCARGETAHEIFARDNVGGGTFGQRIHFCVKDAAHGVQVFERARAEVARDPYMTPALRASLLRQIEVKLAMFRQG